MSKSLFLSIKNHVPTCASAVFVIGLTTATMCFGPVARSQESSVSSAAKESGSDAAQSPAQAARNYRLRLTLENIKALQSVHPAFAEEDGEEATKVRNVVFLSENGKLKRVTGKALPMPRKQQKPAPVPETAEESSSDSSSDSESPADSKTSKEPDAEGSAADSSIDGSPETEEANDTIRFSDQMQEPLAAADRFKQHFEESIQGKQRQAVRDTVAEPATAPEDSGSTEDTGPSEQATESESKPVAELEESKAGELEELFGVPGLGLPSMPPQVAPAPVGKEETPAEESSKEEQDSDKEVPESALEMDGAEALTGTEDLAEAETRPKKKIPAKLASGPLSDGKTDEADEDEAECPGAPDGSEARESLQPGDIPLEQDSHPYDAPKARSIADIETIEDASPVYSQREIKIHDGINRTLAYFLNNPETVVRRGPWALMHATLPFGVEAEVVAGNRKVNAIGWMCYNGVCARQRMFQPTRTGFRTNVGPGVQGHEGQFLAILAQSRVSADYPIKIGSRSYTIDDLVKYEMATCREKSELTFKLIGLSYYLEPDVRWRDSRGHIWNLEKLLAEELAQPVNGAACGGTHRLMALSYALIERQRKGQPIDGTWARAESYLNDYVNYTMTLQNSDGSFSTNWFESRGNDRDTKRRVQTTGHMLEWLIFTLPDEHLRSPRIQLSMEYLLRTVGANPSYDWPIGPRGHALRAMALYNQRVFGAQEGQMKSYIANEGGIRIR